MPAELLALPQQQRVRRLTRQISSLFSEYDNGRCSLDVFRERLRQLGVDETEEFRRALRMPADLTFATLFRALCTADAAPASPAGAPSARGTGGARSDLHMQVGAGRSVPSAGRRLGPPGGRRDSDVISWRGSKESYAAREDTASPAASGHRARAHGAYSQLGGQGAGDAVRMGTPMGGPWVGQGLPSSSSSASSSLGAGSQASGMPGRAAGRATGEGRASYSTGRYDARAMKESGAGAVIYGRGTMAPGADRQGISVSGGVTMHHSMSSQAGQRAAQMARATQGGRGVAATLVDDADKARDDARWESLAQAQARDVVRGAGMVPQSGLGMAPTARAGHGLPDKGLLREQVYSLVRQLDKGMLTAAGFRARAAQMQIFIPPAVDKLLLDFEANGRADFARYVKGFEDYLHARAREAEAAAAAAQAQEGVPVGARGVETAEDRRAREERDAAAGAAAAASARGLGQVQSATRSHGDIIGWHGEAAEKAAKEEEESLRKRGLRPGMQRNTALWNAAATVGSGNPTGGGSAADMGTILGPASLNAAGGLRTTRKGKGPTSIADRSAGNIIAWAAGAPPSQGPGQGIPAAALSPSGQAPARDRATLMAGVSGDPGYTGGGPQGGDLLPDGRPVGKGRAHVDSELGRLAMARGRAPFGTEKDLPHKPQYERGADGRYHRVVSPAGGGRGPSAGHRG